MQLDCPGNVATDSISGALECHDGSGAVVAWVVTPSFDPSQLDTTQLAGAFSAGFVVVGTAWAIGWSVRALLRMIGR